MDMADGGEDYEEKELSMLLADFGRGWHRQDTLSLQAAEYRDGA